jgi:dihydroxyacid dehydratase/phosphogluconate dehydratase
MSHLRLPLEAISMIKDGDIIEITFWKRKLNVLVSDED